MCKEIYKFFKLFYSVDKRKIGPKWLFAKVDRIRV